jgi:hypothetical protein
MAPAPGRLSNELSHVMQDRERNRELELIKQQYLGTEKQASCGCGALLSSPSAGLCCCCAAAAAEEHCAEGHGP